MTSTTKAAAESGTGEVRKDCGPILLVEDDDDTRESLRYILEAEGYEVIEAIHGQDALARLANSKRPCLILLDLMMPVMSGLEFLDALRRDPAHAGTAVVLASAWPERAAAAEGIQGYLTKPFGLADLLGYARRFCSAGPTSSGA